MGFDSVVFADSAALAALSCFSRLAAARVSGRQTLIISLGDLAGAEVITGRGLARVQSLDVVESEGGGPGPAHPLRERLDLIIRRLGPRHVMAPVGLLGAPQTVNYFGLLRTIMSVHTGRDLLFFEERPHCLLPEAVTLRLAALGVRLPPAIDFRTPRRYSSFFLRVVSGLTPPLFGGVADRFRLARAQKAAFREAADWDPQRALGPKLQPVTEPFGADQVDELFEFAAELGQEGWQGSPKTWRRRLQRHAALAGSRFPIERCWLSLPGTEVRELSGEVY